MAKAGSPDLSAFDREAPIPNRAPCSIAVALERLAPARRESLAAALATPRYTHAAIARVLKDWGYKMAAQTVGRHRAGACRCE